MAKKIIQLFIVLISIILVIGYSYLRYITSYGYKPEHRTYNLIETKQISEVKRDSFQKLFDNVLDEVKSYSTVNLPDEYFQPTIPLICPKIKPDRCTTYMQFLSTYTKRVPGGMKVELIKSDKIHGFVDKSKSNKIFLTKKLFEGDEDELKRTIVHELAHLAYLDDADHGTNKINCGYWQTIPLVCEYCFTSIATFMINGSVKNYQNIKFPLQSSYSYQNNDTCFLLTPK